MPRPRGLPMAYMVQQLRPNQARHRAASTKIGPGMVSLVIFSGLAAAVLVKGSISETHFMICH